MNGIQAGDRVKIDRSRLRGRETALAVGFETSGEVVAVVKNSLRLYYDVRIASGLVVRLMPDQVEPMAVAL